jgi:V/A-type H+-transporting ATPase subunit F
MAERGSEPGTRAPSQAGGLRLVVAVRPADALGFRLAGVEVEAVAPGAEADAARRLLGEPRTGVLAVEDEVLAAMPGRLLARARARGLPVILPFAMPRGAAEGKGSAYVAALVRRAVGYGVKLGGGGTS